MLDRKTKLILFIVACVISILFLVIFLGDLFNTYQIEAYGSIIKTSFYIGAIFLGGTFFYFIELIIIHILYKILKLIKGRLKYKTSYEILSVSLGLILGLIIANLLSFSIINIPKVGTPLSIFLNISLGFLGSFIAISKNEEIGKTLFSIKKADKQIYGCKLQGKILDTSVIIDGRILDICKAGFIEGPLIIPIFILHELQHIADSADSLKRNRGRRGLDILNIIQNDLDLPVEILEDTFEDIVEVDSKLVKLAEQMEGIIITNDYNLNKVAKFQGVSVLNINELANAVKPVVLPGEVMKVQVVKDGKENGQGIAYLDDGTMVVIESGKRFINHYIEVLVTSILQTSAGKMIFAKPRYSIEKVV